MPISLGELAARFGCELIGDPDVVVGNVASLQNADAASLSFLSNPTFKDQLSSTQAAVVIVRPDDADDCPVAAILHDDPYVCYARMANEICPPPAFDPGVHASAVVDSTAMIAPSACVSSHVSIGPDTTVGDNAYIGPGSVIGPNCEIGDDCRLVANVTLARAVRIGKRGIIHPGVVLGADGFGNAMTPDGWIKVPQVGGVRIGNDVEIGANTTVDCGAIDDTVIEDGVRIDNLCMIAHNVRIGAHTALAAMVGIAGSTTIGKRCLFAGKAGSVGHISICDDVVLGAQSFASKDIKEPGTYLASFPAEPAREWTKRVGRFRRIEALQNRVRKLEKQ